MKPACLALAALALAAGTWAILASVSHSTPTPDDALTVAQEPSVKEATPPHRARAPAESDALGRTPDRIGSLRFREHTIHLYAGGFTIEDSDGETLADLVTQKEFATLLPELFRDFKPMFEWPLIADNHTHGKVPTDWSYMSAPITVRSVRINPEP